MHRFGGKQGLYAGSASRRLCNAHAVNSCSSGIRCRRLAHRCVLQRGAITSAANDEKASQEQSPKSYANRLQSNPAYQRLKALKQQPQEAGSPQSPAPQGPEAAISAGSAKANSEKAETEKTEAKQNPGQTSPGLSHRQQNRPVGRQAPETDKDNTQSQYVASLPAQDAARQPRASLQPLSALQQTPYASPKANAPVRHADFAQSQQVPKALAVVQFWLTFHAEFGQKLRVVGSHKNLGSWIMVDGPELLWTEGDRWHAKVTLPSGSVYEYKYVLLDSSGSQALNWQRGNNSVLAIKQDEPELEVFDNWEGQPGAAVMVGGKSSTRESKLLAWATDIEAQLGLHRQELRHSKMELASAQEDARRARQEARAVRMELAQSQSIRAQADRLVRELQSSNRLLKSELQATTTSFKQALHAAQTMLDTAEEREQDIPAKVEQEAETAAEAVPDLAVATDQEQAETNQAMQADQQQDDLSASETAASLPVTADSALAEPDQAMQPAATDDLQPESSFLELTQTAELPEAPPGPEDEEAVLPRRPKQQQEAAPESSGGMPGQGAESTTSSNARQQSTSSVASARPSLITKPQSTTGGNTQAGRQSASFGFFDPHPEDATPAGTPVSQSESASQPQMADLPKHGKTPPGSPAASPPKAPGAFPDSERPSESDLMSSGNQAAGKQLETSRTAIPVNMQDSNAAAQAPTSNSHLPGSSEEGPAGANGQGSANDAGSNGQCNAAGKELEAGHQAIPDKPSPSSSLTDAPNASSSSSSASVDTGDKPLAAQEEFASQPQVAHLPKHGKSPPGNPAAAPPKAGGAFPASELPSKSDKISEEEQSAGRELETSHTGVPRNTRQSNAAASKAASSASEQASTVANDALSSGAGQDGSPAGQQLEGEQVIPEKKVRSAQ